MKILSREQITKDLEALFPLTEYPESIIKDGVFLIHKEDATRHEVLARVMDYFSDVRFEPGWQCELSPLTLVYTRFAINDRFDP